MNKLFFILFLPFSLLANADESCHYPTKDGGGEYHYAEHCGVIDGDILRLDQSVLGNLQYDDAGLACVILSSANTFYVHKNGTSRRVVFFDNGCDYFVDGLARGMVGGRMVFLNQTLDIVLAPGFEQASPFDYGHSVVCNGPFRIEQHGEHTFYLGGQCGLINKKGDLVVEAVHKVEDREVFKTYINNNNHCPRPPITSKESALCHGKRHVANMDHHSDDWAAYELSQHGATWLITFIEKNDDTPFTLTVDASSAQWQSLIPEPHAMAIERILKPQ